MGWEQRGQRRYYYRARKENGRTVKEYFGSGEVAEAVAQIDAAQAALRASARRKRLEARAEFDRIDAELEQLDRIARALVALAMEAAGFHWHRGQWRKQMGSANAKDDTEKPDSTEDLMRRAACGDAEAMKQLRPRLDPRRALEAFGNVASLSLDVAVCGFSGKDLLTREAVANKLESLRRELTGPNATPLERLLVDRVVTVWLHLHVLEHDHALGGYGAPDAAEMQRAITSAQKRYFAAIRELMAIRRNVPPTIQVGIASEPAAPREAPPG